jgi:hypothetical protein
MAGYRSPVSISRFAERFLRSLDRPPSFEDGKFVFDDPYKILIVLPDGCTLCVRTAGQAKGLSDLDMIFTANGYATTSGGAAIAAHLLGGTGEIGKTVFTEHLQDPRFISVKSPGRWANLEFLQRNPVTTDWRNATMRTVALTTIAAMHTSSAAVGATRLFTRHLPGGNTISDIAQANIDAITHHMEEVADLYRYPVNPAFLINDVYKRPGLSPNYRQLGSCRVEWNIMVTDLESGQKVAIRNPQGVYKTDSSLRATMHFALAGRPTETHEGRPAWEGAYSGSVYQWALDNGYTDAIVLECKDSDDFRKGSSWYQAIKESAVHLFAPDAAATYAASEQEEIDAHDQVMSRGFYKNKQGEKLNVAIIRVAPSTPAMKKTETRPGKLGPQYDAGRDSFLAALRPHMAGHTVYERVAHGIKQIPVVA